MNESINLPIYYLDKKEPISQSIQTDLELTDIPNSLYNHLFDNNIY